MNRSLNLMSERARMRECLRTRLRLWMQIWAVAFALLAIIGALTWWPAYRAGQHRASLEAEYEPIRLMKAENKSIANQIHTLQEQEKFVLELSENFPMVTLLGIIGKSVSNSQGQVFVDELAYQVGNSDNGAPETTLSIEGLSINREAVSYLTSSLQAAIPFASVKLESIDTSQVNQQTVQTFTIECTF